MEKEDKIKELTAKRDELREKLYNINKEIQDAEVEEYNYEGKFIKFNGSGYQGSMYVTWQKVDRVNYGREVMFFQGFFNNISVTSYTDDFFTQIDALEEVKIPLNTFIEMTKNGKIIEMTKEEFLEELHENMDYFRSAVDSMLDNCIEIFNAKD